MKVLKSVYLLLILAATSFANELINAVERGDIVTVEKLLNENVNIDFQNDYGFTALMYASRNRHKEIVEMLLDKGANVNLQDNYRNPALISASIFGYKEIVEMLLNSGADIDLQSKAGNTALMWTSRLGHKDIVKMLLEAGANVDLKNTGGNTALRQASRNSHEEIVNILKLEKAIKENGGLKPYVDNLSKEDLAWLVDRVVRNRNVGSLKLSDLEVLLPEFYKKLIEIYKGLKSGTISEEEIKNILLGKADISKLLKEENVTAYKLLRNYVKKILDLSKIKEGIPLDVAAKIVFEY